jgi:hypothetical protein
MGKSTSAGAEATCEIQMAGIVPYRVICWLSLRPLLKKLIVKAIINFNPGNF